MKLCKVIIYVLFYLLSAKIINCHCFYLISSSWKNARWLPCLVTSQTFSSATTHKYTSSCREGQRLSTESKIEIRGGSINHTPTPPPLPPHCTTVRVWLCVYVRGLSRRITSNEEKFGLSLLIIKSTCYSSLMRGAGVSTQQFSSLQENKI